MKDFCVSSPSTTPSLLMILISTVSRSVIYCLIVFCKLTVVCPFLVNCCIVVFFRNFLTYQFCYLFMTFLHSLCTPQKFTISALSQPMLAVHMKRLQSA